VVAADGKVFIGTQNGLVVYGLRSGPSALAGHGQFLKIASIPSLPSKFMSGNTEAFWGLLFIAPR